MISPVSRCQLNENRKKKWRNWMYIFLGTLAACSAPKSSMYICKYETMNFLASDNYVLQMQN